MAKVESKPQTQKIADPNKVTQRRLEAGWENFLLPGEEPKVQALMDEYFPNTEGYKTPEHNIDPPEFDNQASDSAN